MFSDVLLLKVQAINNQHVQCCCSTHKEKEFNVWKFEKFPVAFLLEKVFFLPKSSLLHALALYARQAGLTLSPSESRHNVKLGSHSALPARPNTFLATSASQFTL